MKGLPHLRILVDKEDIRADLSPGKYVSTEMTDFCDLPFPHEDITIIRKTIHDYLKAFWKTEGVSLDDFVKISIEDKYFLNFTVWFTVDKEQEGIEGIMDGISCSVDTYEEEETGVRRGKLYEGKIFYHRDKGDGK